MTVPFRYDLQFNVNLIRNKSHVFCLLKHVVFTHGIYITNSPRVCKLLTTTLSGIIHVVPTSAAVVLFCCILSYKRYIVHIRTT